MTERRRKREADLVVVGCGLEALMVSALAAEAGMRVIHYRTARGLLPEHDWFHSGLLLGTDPASGRLIRVWGRNMLRAFGMSTRLDNGVFVARTDDTAERLMRSAAELGIHISEIPAQKAARIAGPHFSNMRSYVVPDALFDKAALAGVAQSCCVSGGASVIDLDLTDRISLLPSGTMAGGVLVQTSRELTEGAVTVLADGGMIPALVEALGISHPLAVYRSPLVTMPGPTGLRAGLLVDIDRGLSYVRHKSREASCVLYTIGPTGNSVARGNDAIAELAPAEMWPSHARPERRTVAVAHSIEKAHVDGASTVLPWIHQFKREGFPGLIATVSNVANLALWTARRVMRLIKPSSPEEE